MTINTQRIETMLAERGDAIVSSAPWFKLFGRHQAIFDAVSDEQAGVAIKAALAYLNTGELVHTDSMAAIVFAAPKEDIDQCIADYQATCERNRNNGQKGGRPPKKPVPTEGKITDEGFEAKRNAAMRQLLNYRPT